jgi:adenosylhomocysteinase
MVRDQLQAELAKYDFSLPVLRELGHQIRYHSHLRDKTIGWHCHLTEITAAAVEVVLEAGAKVVLSECDPHTSSDDAIQYMRKLGAEIYLGPPESCQKVLAHKPMLLADTGFQLINTYLELNLPDADRFVFAASEITTSGISILRDRTDGVPLPVVNINSGRLKTNIENFHGVGDGVIDLLFQLTGRIWSGRKTAVVGYGNVGAGVCHYLRRNGCDVMVIENDPVRRLIAHYDGYRTGSLQQALSDSELLVTATGKDKIIPDEQHWQTAADGLIVVNVGHWAAELNMEALKRITVETRPVNDHLVEYTLQASGRRVYVATEGSPANVVMLAGSPEPTLIHLTTEVLCMNYLASLQHNSTTLATGELALPGEVEHQASVLALRALKISD